ncbi:serine protease [Streptomyces sp. WAC 06738]|uniref:S1 family peptidase n=1 Tax=Streptomyces sp. WAC 06738 TaxID=2203210 RepID=UPI000F6FA789|nr:S1 family peptidase [Streptomyces sp. WAC 06738]AZM48959.1 serine protease [Streptomyces sp. WAC 06738]
MRPQKSARLGGTIAALLLLGTAALGSTAAAAPPPADRSGQGVQADAATLALDADVTRTLGSDSAGTYLDAETGDLVVTVTDKAAAAEARAAGARAELVEHSAAELRSAMGAFEDRAKITGTSWGVDPATNQIAVQADSTVSAAEYAKLKSVARSLDGAARVERVPGAFKKEVLGGDAIYGGGYRCSAAFNVTKNNARYFVTAGHCTNAGASWSATSGGAAIGTREGTSFPTNDYGIVRYTDGSSPAGTVNLYNGSTRDITSAANAVVGQAIQKSGSTTQVTSGTVTAVNVTVNYSDGPVYNMVRTTACSAGGDSGGAHFSGNVAYGIHSGSSGCSGTNGSAIHQPVTEALSAYGVSVY